MAITNEQVAELAKYFERLAKGIQDYLNEEEIDTWETHPEYSIRQTHSMNARMMNYVSQLLLHVSEGDAAGIYDAKDTLSSFVSVKRGED